MDNILISDIHFNPENELWHHGVMGMKWGIRRYQPYSLIPRKSGKGGKEQGAAKKSKGKGKSNSVGRAGNTKVKKIVGVKKSRNQKSAEAKAAIEKQAKTARQRKEELDKIVKSGDAKLVYEHKSELTNKQLNDAIERINTEARVKALVSSQNPGKMKKLKDFARTVDDLNSVVKTGVNAYRTAEDIVKISKGIKDAAEKKSKAEASAEILKNIVDAGATAKDVRELQSKLSDSDLNKLRERVKSLDEIGKVERGDEKRASDAKDKQAAYLKKSLADLEKANKTDAEFSKMFSDAIERSNKRDDFSQKDSTSKNSETPKKDSSNNKVINKPVSLINDNRSAEYWDNVASGKMVSKEEAARLLKAIDAKERRDKQPRMSTKSVSVKRTIRTSPRPEVDENTYWDNVTSGKMVSKEEAARLLQEIEDSKRPGRKLKRKNK